MVMNERPSPRNKPVALFVTCIIDAVFPSTGLSVLRLLEHAGVRVSFPMGQTCCGQPAYNSGYRNEARTVACQFIRAFADAEVIVTPSGSCAAMVRHEYPRLFADDSEWLGAAERVASRTWEFTEFLVDGLGVTDLGLTLPEPRRFAYHDACHGLRLLKLGPAARLLLTHVRHLQLCDLVEHDVCCGFGGLFAVKMPQVSVAMLDTKIRHIDASEADTIITGDCSCMAQMNGGLSRQGSSKRVMHVADVLAEGLPRPTK